MNKSYRHGQILNLIRTRRIRTQQDLARALRAAGVHAAQGTLSRDMRELGLVKTPHGYAVPANVAPHGPDLETVARESLLDVKQAQHILVLATPPGHASPLAEAIDRAGWPEVAGTVAGENTVLAVAFHRAGAAALRKKLLALLG